jgi:para-nitrobenzyl esterase
MRALTPEQVAAAFPRTQTMIVDNYAIPEDPAIVFAEGRQHPVDVLMGANASEMSFGGRGGGRGRAAGPGGPAAPAATATPPAPSADPQSALVFWRGWRIAEYAREAGQDAWVYWFGQSSPGPEGSPASPPVHAAEVKYVFDNLGEIPLYPDTSNPELAAASAADQRVADLVASYWVNFARNGNPNGRGLPEWPEHTGPDEMNVAILAAEPSTVVAPTLEEMQARDAELEQALAGRQQ